MYEEWLTLTVMFVKIMGEGRRLMFHSMVPLNATMHHWEKSHIDQRILMLLLICLHQVRGGKITNTAHIAHF